MLGAANTASAGSLLTGVGIIGVGNGLTFRITLANVNHLAPGRRRAEIVSAYDIAMYSGIGAALVATAVLADASSPRSATALVTAAIGAGVIVLVACEHTAGRAPRTRFVVDNAITAKERP